MATGRRDYTSGFLIETYTGGRYISSFNINEGSTIDYGTSILLYQYTVPVNYRLALNRIIISTDSGHRSRISFYDDSVLIFGLYFGINFIYDISDRNPYYIQQNKTLKIYIYNNDDVSNTYILSLIGSLEQLN